MTDPTSARLDLDRAGRAEALLRNELLQEAFQALDAKLTEAWKASNADDWKGREQLFAYMRTLQRLKEHLEAIVRNGVIAAHDLKLMEEK